MTIIDSKTSLIIGDPGSTDLYNEKATDKTCDYCKTLQNRIRSNLNRMILSASGWRKIFSLEEGENNNEDSMSGAISPEDTFLVSSAAYIFGNYIINATGRKKPVISVGLDSRPTGPEIGRAVVKTLVAMGFEVRYHFIVSAPEIMAYVKQTEESDGFIYISASHNPSGYNGIKFGPSTGAVLGGSESAEIIRNFRDFITNSDPVGFLENLTKNITSNDLEKAYIESEKWKSESYKSYLQFNKSIFTFSGRYNPEGKKHDIGIVADMNGSARCVSIDRDFFNILGIKSFFFNSTAGVINHPILPEGENLDFCRIELEKKYREDSSFVLGYMPDNDGDRGNLVYINSGTGRAEILEAQEVFALACLSELAFMVYSGILRYDSSGRLTEKCAVAVNGPTSMRIEKICSAFGVEVFRSEVGEANVVNLSRRLMEDGWIIRLLGEGSNGGNITYPATVRDPMNTIGSILKLLTIKTENNNGKIIPGLFEIWKEKSGYSNTEIISENSGDLHSLSDIIKTLPSFTTTSTGEKDAKMQIKTVDHGILKNNYEKIFLSEWDIKKQELEKTFGITGWEEINYMGTEAVSGTGPDIRKNHSTGGFKIIFKKFSGEPAGFIWMRGSGTEPVFRVMADIEGRSAEKEKYLLNWHREMISRADNM